MILLILFSLNLRIFAEDGGTRGAVYDLNGSTLSITTKSLKMIDRLDDGNHAEKILNGKIPPIQIKEALERIQASHDLEKEKTAMFSPASNLLIEFEGRVANLVMTHICRGKDGNYLAVYVPDIYYAENVPVNINGQEKIIKQLMISTDPSNALLLQKKLFWGAVGDYWRFFLKQIDYDKKFKVLGLVNYAGQTSDKDGIQKLELMIVVIKISPIQ